MKSSILKELQRIELAIRGIDPLADITELEAAQSDMQALIAALQATDASLWDQIVSNSSVSANLQSQISSNDSDISGHNSRISALEASGVGGGLSVAIVQDQKPLNTGGGTFTAGAWRTRDLNTIVSDPDSIIVSLTSNQFVLVNGDYLIMAILPSHFVGYNQGRIKDVTNNAIIATSATSYGRVTYGGQDYCHLFCQFSSTGQSVAIQHACEITRVNAGFGLSPAVLPSPGVGVYTQLLMLKIG